MASNETKAVLQARLNRYEKTMEQSWGYLDSVLDDDDEDDDEDDDQDEEEEVDWKETSGELLAALEHVRDRLGDELGIVVDDDEGDDQDDDQD